MKALIAKYETKLSTLTKIILEPKTSHDDFQKATVCRRLVVEILNDLKTYG